MTKAVAKRQPHATFSAATTEAPRRAVKAASQWTALPGGVVDGGEIVILAIKPSMWRPLFESTPALVFCGLLVVTLTSLSRPMAGLSMTATAQVIVLVGLSRLAFALLRWVPTWYVLTNRRVISIQGVRSPRITACALVKIRNTYLSSSPAEQMARLGTITFSSDRLDDPPRRWHSITAAGEVHAAVRRAIEHAIDHHGYGG